MTILEKSELPWCIGILWHRGYRKLWQSWDYQSYLGLQLKIWNLLEIELLCLLLDIRNSHILMYIYKITRECENNICFTHEVVSRIIKFQLKWQIPNYQCTCTYTCTLVHSLMYTYSVYCVQWCTCISICKINFHLFYSYQNISL